VVSGTMTDFPATLELDPLFLQVEPPTLYLLQLQTAATARGGRWQRGVPYTVAIVSSRCIDWCPPIGGGGHGWRDAPVGSTFSEIQLTIA
jgi:hypothetical protein